MLFVLYHQILVRNLEETRMGKVWEWDIYLVRLLKVRRVLVNRSCPDRSRLQVKRLQHEPGAFSVEGHLTLLPRSRKSSQWTDLR